MKCREALDLLGELVDDEVDDRSRWRVRLHLLICRHCRQYLSSYRATVEAEKAAFRFVENPADAEEMPDALVTAILDASRGR